MQTTRQADTPLTQLLIAWVAYKVGRQMTSLKPAHSAESIAAQVARQGCPTGG